MLIERYVGHPRHIEIQVFADRHGNAIHLGERDCSLQRRHQKVIEEAPAPGMTAELRTQMGAAAVAAAKAVGYEGAGTVEFIADGEGGLKASGFWFMEMNTRLQVEHPVTEAITGLDLVEWQFRVAAGEPLPLKQDQVRFSGHAAEARIYAEDPAHGFLPSTGKLVALQFPSGEGLRVDAGVDVGSEVTPFYDPMVAKLIAHAATRDLALDRLANALEATVAIGPRTNLGFLAALARAPGFRGGDFDTGFIDRNLSQLAAPAQGVDPAVVALAAEKLMERENSRIETAIDRDADTPVSPWDSGDAFQLSGKRGRWSEARNRRDRGRHRCSSLRAAQRPADQSKSARCGARRGCRRRPGRPRARADARQGARAAGGRGRGGHARSARRHHRGDEDGAHAHGTA